MTSGRALLVRALPVSYNHLLLPSTNLWSESKQVVTVGPPRYCLLRFLFSVSIAREGCVYPHPYVLRIFLIHDYPTFRLRLPGPTTNCMPRHPPHCRPWLCTSDGIMSTLTW